MEPPIYDGKIHPNEYVKKMRVYCNFRQIINEQDILRFAIMMIDSTINVPENINSFDALINALKDHISFTVFKNSCKRKLQTLKYISDYGGDNTVNFITDFRTFCRDAEITNIEEQKKYLFNALPYDFFKNEFAIKQKNVNSMDELIKTFEEIVSDYSRIIRNGSIIALRHVGTGKYLSSCYKKYPQQNNQQYQYPTNRYLESDDESSEEETLEFQSQSMVYCGDFGPNALWSINNIDNNYHSISSDYNHNANISHIHYKSSIQLQHKILSKYIYTNISKQSPTSSHFEVCCGDYNNYQLPWSIKHYHNRDDRGNVKSQDIVLLLWNNNNNYNNNLRGHRINNRFSRPSYNNVNNQHERIKDIVLRSHDLKFIVENENYQEVVTHDERIGGNDQWCIELVEYPQKQIRTGNR
ncbi:hypothetical protein RclHR1_12290006 [Rhizophagus clarus]|uniref:MIR domain-containing protein n=1 Tax=Rhizophagus clarus TaxID=94130 RepID=A0A2Z6Q6R9_9GLOM|nr:hypothetical protein RclHR1_12290006 [Rhizophagus clarus]GES92676.1 hypothetical protein GLOIN_2v1774010 [Rhizophagus clarus]